MSGKVEALKGKEKHFIISLTYSLQKVGKIHCEKIENIDKQNRKGNNINNRAPPPGY